MRKHRFAMGVAVVASLLMIQGLNAAESPSPSLQVVTEQPASINVGDSFTYSITVRNTSTAKAAKTVLTAQVPTGATLVKTEPAGVVAENTITWELGDVDGGVAKAVAVTVTPSQKVNLSSCATVRYETAVCSIVKVTQPKLAISKTGPAMALKGDPIQYTVRVTNTGDGPASDVVMTDKLPAGLKRADGQEFSVQVGTLAAGESKVFMVPCVAAQVGEFCNVASVKGKGLDSISAEACTKVVEPKLTIAKTGPALRYLGRVAKYEITVSNPGTANATNVTVVDPIPAGTSFVSASTGGQFNATANNVVWSLGTLEPGKSRKLTVALKADKIMEICNVASATADRNLTASAKACTKVKGIPAILLEVIDIEDPVEVGAETTYVITVTNQGSLEDRNVKIGVTLPEGQAFVSASGPVAHKIAEQVVTFEPLPILKPKAVATYRMVVKGTKAGDWRYKVALNSDNTTRPVNEEESTHVYSDE